MASKFINFEDNENGLVGHIFENAYPSALRPHRVTLEVTSGINLSGNLEAISAEVEEIARKIARRFGILIDEVPIDIEAELEGFEELTAVLVVSSTFYVREMPKQTAEADEQMPLRGFFYRS